jgi:S-adenosylmethionine hydrolase
MKGVIWAIAPELQIADISHDISPQNVMEGAIAWGRTVPYFPEGSVHIGVIDPGVGTQRRPIAARLGDQYFVLPDNGLISILLDHAESQNQVIKFVHLDQPKYWLSEISHVFHGRDIFSPVGAHLANGIRLEALGSPIDNPIRLEIPSPKHSTDSVIGEVITIDNFGNLASNIMRSDLERFEAVNVHISGEEIEGLVTTFGERPPGELIALYGTHSDLLISVVNGNAARHLNAKVGDVIEVFPKDKA